MIRAAGEYIDGILQSELKTGYTNTNLSNLAPLAIGRDYQANNEYFDGIIDEIRIWKIALEGYAPGDPCVKVIPYASEIVAHFNFDEGSGNIIKDKSSLKLDGTLMNMSTTTAWVISGAPIGNYGFSTFGAINAPGFQYNASLADGTRIFVEPIGEIKGIYVYYVDGSPNSTNGLNSSEPAKAYFGVFTPLSPNVRHKVSYIVGQEECSSRFFERHDNSVQQWHELQTTLKSDTATGIMTSSRGEYIIDQIPSQNLEIQGALSFCRGSSTQLTVYTSGSVKWNNGVKEKSITVTTPGIYEATITINNCIITKKVEVVENPLPNFSLGPNSSICKGEKVTLHGPPNMNSYTWSTGSRTQTSEITHAGTYWLEVTNESGCNIRESVTITYKQEPTAELPDEIYACLGETVKLNATTEGAIYLWSNGQTTPEVEVVSPVVISLTLTMDGCTYKKVINVIDEECITIPNIITPNGDNKNDYFLIRGAIPDNLELEIFNRWGKSVYKKAQYDNTWAAEGLSPGIYYYYVKSRLSSKEYKGWLEVLK